MKSFKVFDGKVKIDGVLYGTSPSTDVNVKGKMGTIHSVMIQGRGQFFPISGEFNDGTTIVDSTTEVLDTPTKKKKSKKSTK